MILTLMKKDTKTEAIKWIGDNINDLKKFVGKYLNRHYFRIEVYNNKACLTLKYKDEKGEWLDENNQFDTIIKVGEYLVYDKSATNGFINYSLDKLKKRYIVIDDLFLVL